MRRRVTAVCRCCRRAFRSARRLRRAAATIAPISPTRRCSSRSATACSSRRRATLITTRLRFSSPTGSAAPAFAARGCFAPSPPIPILAPSLLPAISLVYLFGNQGLLKDWMIGATIYGPIGIVIGEVFYTLPHAVMILLHRAVARRRPPVRGGARCWAPAACKTFFTVTLPGVRYGRGQRDPRGLHPGDHRFRRAEGDRRPLQRARHRRLQAGGRPAELRDGRGRRHDPADPGAARLLRRPLRAEASRRPACRRARCRTSRSRTPAPIASTSGCAF